MEPGPLRFTIDGKHSAAEEQGRRSTKETAMAVGIFAGIPVRDFTSGLEWYKRLLGAEPAFYPNDIEAVWRLAEDRYLYIIQDPGRAGGAVSMIWHDDPAAEVAKISGRGLEPVGIEKHDSVWKYVFHDSDGNETGIGGEVSPSG
jgi:hypothetical protein